MEKGERKKLNRRREREAIRFVDCKKNILQEIYVIHFICIIRPLQNRYIDSYSFYIKPIMHSMNITTHNLVLVVFLIETVWCFWKKFVPDMYVIVTSFHHCKSNNYLPHLWGLSENSNNLFVAIKLSIIKVQCFHWYGFKRNTPTLLLVVLRH